MMKRFPLSRKMSYIMRYWFVKKTMCYRVKPFPDIANLKLHIEEA